MTELESYDTKKINQDQLVRRKKKENQCGNFRADKDNTSLTPNAGLSVPWSLSPSSIVSSVVRCIVENQARCCKLRINTKTHKVGVNL